jgi:type I restriction enzyme M protein
VGLGDQDEDDEPFEEKMERLVDLLAVQMAESDRLNAEVKVNLERLGF